MCLFYFSVRLLMLLRRWYAVLLHHLRSLVCSDVSEKHAASIFRVIKFGLCVWNETSPPRHHSIRQKVIQST